MPCDVFGGNAKGHWPILNRRIGLAVGLQYVILAVAAGKAFGSAVYFLRGFG